LNGVEATPISGMWGLEEAVDRVRELDHAAALPAS